MPLPGSVATVTVGGTVEHPTTGQLATGTVKFELAAALATSEGYVLGDAVPSSYAVANGVFVAQPVLPANNSVGLVPQGWTYKVTVATDVWAAVFYASLPSSPTTTTLAALYAQRATAPVAGTSYVPLSAVGVTVAPLVDGVVPPRYGYGAGLRNASLLTPYGTSGTVTLPAGTYENLAFVVDELLMPNSNTVVRNCSIVAAGQYGVRMDANTGEETGRLIENCTITSAGPALAGAGFTARRILATGCGDDFARIGRSHGEPTVIEDCVARDFRPNTGAHADGVQVLTKPAADVIVRGCDLHMNTAAGYTRPVGAGYTGAIFVAYDVPVAGGDPEPTRSGFVWVDGCRLQAEDNYVVVIDEQGVDVSRCAIGTGTTATESINNGARVTGAGNTDLTGAPLVTAIHSDPRPRYLTVGDPRQAGGGGASTFAGLTDVDVSGVTDGQVAAWNSTAARWKPVTPATGGGGGSGFPPVRVTSGPQTGTFGGGSGGVQPTGIPPSRWWLTLPANKVAVGHLLQWSMPLISTGADAECDLASLVAGAPVNFYSDNFGPTQNVNGHSGLYVAGDYGADQGPVVWWVVQPTDLAGDGTFTISFLFQPSGSHRWGSDVIPGQVDLVNFGPAG
jgi:hypothetical protein